MKPLGDRRARVRFEVLGTLRGTLELKESARLINISTHGALIESSAKVAVGSHQEFQLTIDGQPTRVSARVRHVEAVHHSGESTYYVVGVEFLSPSSTLTESIAQLSDRS